MSFDPNTTLHIQHLTMKLVTAALFFSVVHADPWLQNPCLTDDFSDAIFCDPSTPIDDRVKVGALPLPITSVSIGPITCFRRR